MNLDAQWNKLFKNGIFKLYSMQITTFFYTFFDQKMLKDIKLISNTDEQQYLEGITYNVCTNLDK